MSVIIIITFIYPEINGLKTKAGTTMTTLKRGVIHHHHNVYLF